MKRNLLKGLAAFHLSLLLSMTSETSWSMEPIQPGGDYNSGALGDLGKKTIGVEIETKSLLIYDNDTVDRSKSDILSFYKDSGKSSYNKKHNKEGFKEFRKQLGNTITPLFYLTRDESSPHAEKGNWSVIELYTKDGIDKKDDINNIIINMKTLLNDLKNQTKKNGINLESSLEEIYKSKEKEKLTYMTESQEGKIYRDLEFITYNYNKVLYSGIPYNIHYAPQLTFRFPLKLVPEFFSHFSKKYPEEPSQFDAYMFTQAIEGGHLLLLEKTLQEKYKKNASQRY